MSSKPCPRIGRYDPFKMIEKDGYYYGRGTTDMKDGIVAITQAMIDLKKAGFQPKRDIVVLFTGDEETNGIGAKKGASSGSSCSATRNMVSTRMAAAAGSIRTILLRAIRSRPRKRPSPITPYCAQSRRSLVQAPQGQCHLQPVHALDKLEAYRFQPMMNETTRAYFEGRAKTEKGPLGDAMRRWLANPNDGEAADIIEASESEVGLTRTRCVATRLFAGHADNALPQLATATRQLPHLPRRRSQCDPRRTRAAGRRSRSQGDARRR